jgi:hypothetical protein
MLREAYAMAGDKRGLSARIDALQRRLGVPRASIIDQARREGLTYAVRRQWTAAEDEYLQEASGAVSVRTMARRLARSVHSVEGRVKRLALSRRMAYGYNQAELAAALGVHRTKVQRWMERGLMGKVHMYAAMDSGHRITEASVMEFLRRHPHEYDMRRVDQIWLKAMLFGAVSV